MQKGAKVNGSIETTDNFPVNGTLTIAVEGNNTITNVKDVSSVRILKGNLTIIGVTGISNPTLTINETKGRNNNAIYLKRGKLIISNVNLVTTNAKLYNALEVNGAIDISGANLTTDKNGWVYASQGITPSSSCSWDSKSGYVIDSKREKAVNVRISRANSGASNKISVTGLTICGKSQLDYSTTTSIKVGGYTFSNAKMLLLGDDRVTHYVPDAMIHCAIYYDTEKNALILYDAVVKTNAKHVISYTNSKRPLQIWVYKGASLSSSSGAIFCGDDTKVDIYGDNVSTTLKIDKMICQNGQIAFCGVWAAPKTIEATGNNSRLQFSNSNVDISNNVSGIKTLIVNGCAPQDSQSSLLWDVKNGRFCEMSNQDATPVAIKNGASFRVTNPNDNFVVGEKTTGSNQFTFNGQRYGYFKKAPVGVGTFRTSGFSVLGQTEWKTTNELAIFSVNGKDRVCTAIDIPKSQLTQGKVYLALSSPAIVLDKVGILNTNNKSFVSGNCSAIYVNGTGECRINAGTAVAINSTATAGLIIKGYNTGAQNFWIGTNGVSCIIANGPLQINRLQASFMQVNATASAIKTGGNFTSEYAHLKFNQTGSSKNAAGIECTSAGKLATISNLTAKTGTSSIKGFDNVVGILPAATYKGKDFYYDKTNKRFMISNNVVTDLQLVGGAGGNYKMDTRQNNIKRGNLTVWPISAAKVAPDIAL